MLGIIVTATSLTVHYYLLLLLLSTLLLLHECCNITHPFYNSFFTSIRHNAVDNCHINIISVVPQQTISRCQSVGPGLFRSRYKQIGLSALWASIYIVLRLCTPVPPMSHNNSNDLSSLVSFACSHACCLSLSLDVKFSLTLYVHPFR